MLQSAPRGSPRTRWTSSRTTWKTRSTCKPRSLRRTWSSTCCPRPRAQVLSSPSSSACWRPRPTSCSRRHSRTGSSTARRQICLARWSRAFTKSRPSCGGISRKPRRISTRWPGSSSSGTPRRGLKKRKGWLRKRRLGRRRDEHAARSSGLTCRQHLVAKLKRRRRRKPLSKRRGTGLGSRPAKKLCVGRRRTPSSWRDWRRNDRRKSAYGKNLLSVGDVRRPKTPQKSRARLTRWKWTRLTNRRMCRTTRPLQRPRHHRESALSPPKNRVGRSKVSPPSSSSFVKNNSGEPNNASATRPLKRRSRGEP
mmetsp:Transcript_1265/g.3956  ORF Transcript_1265/g.3956 Transcript_1265/m.3956 type:complete len:309 (-) Transcript_1265:238-1164(-)